MDGDPAQAPESWGVMGDALAAYIEGDGAAVLVMRTDVGGAEDVPVSLFFRSVQEMGPVETTALEEARGRTLDLGSGPGAHAIPLAGRGLPVTAAEVVPQARVALTRGGVEDVRPGGLETVAADETFDTVLVLMNGLGLAGDLEGLPGFLAALGRVLSPGGQVLADSTDPREWADEDDGRYPGEVHMQLGFRGRWGEPFPFLFVDPDILEQVAATVGLDTQVLATEDDGRYLARITLAPPPPAP